MSCHDVELKRKAVSFGVFEADFCAREVRKHGAKLRIQEQPLQLLEVLLERPGEIVSREEIQARIWPADTFVDFDKGVYNAAKKLREALGDTAATPVFIETVPKRGYRFVAPISRPDPVGIAEPADVPAPQLHKPAERWNLLRRAGLACSVLVLLLLSGHVRPTPSVSAALGERQGGISIDEDALHDTLMAYARGADGNLYQFVWPWNPSGLSPITGFANRPAAAQGSGVASHVNTITGQPEVFYVAANGHVMHISLFSSEADDLNATGAPLAAQGTNLAGVMDDCAHTDNVFYIGVDRHLHLLTSSLDGGWTAMDLTAYALWRGMGHAPEVEGSQVAALAGGGSTQVFYFASDHHVHEFWRWSGCSGEAVFDGWHGNDVNLASGGAPAAAAESGLTASIFAPKRRRTIFYEDQSHHVRELSYPVASRWENIDVTSAAGVPSMGEHSLASQVIPTTGAARLYFLDSNHDVHMLAADEAVPERWTEPYNAAINKLAEWCEGSSGPAPLAREGSPLAASPGMVNALRKMEPGEVYYLGADGDMYRLAAHHSEDSHVIACADISRAAKSPELAP
jgi:DNA-binding winged helix-turn-helix (wHTH) protein